MPGSKEPNCRVQSRVDAADRELFAEHLDPSIELTRSDQQVEVLTLGLGPKPPSSSRSCLRKSPETGMIPPGSPYTTSGTR